MHPVYFCLFYYFWLPRVLFGLFNSAHPIIRNLGWTSSRLSLLPGTAVGRTDRGGAHWLSCCYVLRLCARRGGAPLLWLLHRNVWHRRGRAESEAPGADPRTPLRSRREGGPWSRSNKKKERKKYSLISQAFIFLMRDEAS